MAAAQTVMLDPVVVTGQLDQARESILPSLGATSFVIDANQIENQPQAADAPFNQVLLRAPGVAADSAANGDLHVRGEHANLQYRIDGVLLPEGITGFGLELDPRFVSSLQLITGSLPAQYGFRTAGVVDIQTKSGTLDPGGAVSLYGGSFDTIRPSFEAGGAAGAWSYFVDGSYDHNDLGIENPNSGTAAIHDATEQSKTFASFTDILDRTSRISFMLSASVSSFQVPDTPGLPAGTAPDGDPWLPGSFDSAKLSENQHEQNYYAVATYQKSAGDLNYQISAFGRDSGVHFTPDPVGDLYFNGVASDVDRVLDSAGLQLRPRRPSHPAERRDAPAGGGLRRLDHDGLSHRQRGRPDRAGVSHRGCRGTPWSVRRRVRPGRMECPPAADRQLRGAVRQFRLVLRPRDPAQPARQRHLAGGRSDHAARWLRPLLHASSGGERSSRRRGGI